MRIIPRLFLVITCIWIIGSLHAQDMAEPTYFRDSAFVDYADFWDKEYDSFVDFTNASFPDAEFNNSRFDAGVTFSQASFNSYVDFMDAKFDEKSDFFRTTYHANALFQSVKFESIADFSYANFMADATFVQDTFNTTARFTNATFAGAADFTEAEFNGDLEFIYATFDSLLRFKRTEFHGDVDFTAVTLPKWLDFSYVNSIAGEIDLTRALINAEHDTCYINLTGANIDNFSFRYNRFKLWFPPEDSIGFELKSNVYEVLLEKQRDEGFTQSYETLDKEYRAFKYTQAEADGFGKAWGYFSNWVDKRWWGYGYNKELIVINTIILYLLFAFLNTFFLKHLTVNVYEAEKINEYWEESTGSGLRMYFKSIPFSLFYTAQIFFSFRFDVDKLKYKENLQGWKIFNLIYFIMMYLAGLVCFAYLANYVVTV